MDSSSARVYWCLMAIPPSGGAYTTAGFVLPP
nr:MAG TPA: hypothetical protein [Caudoviricetes sp.]